MSQLRCCHLHTEYLTLNGGIVITNEVDRNDQGVQVPVNVVVDCIEATSHSVAPPRDDIVVDNRRIAVNSAAGSSST